MSSRVWVNMNVFFCCWNIFNARSKCLACDWLQIYLKKKNTSKAMLTAISIAMTKCCRFYFGFVVADTSDNIFLYRIRIWYAQFFYFSAQHPKQIKFAIKISKTYTRTHAVFDCGISDVTKPHDIGLSSIDVDVCHWAYRYHFCVACMMRVCF